MVWLCVCGVCGVAVCVVWVEWARVWSTNYLSCDRTVPVFLEVGYNVYQVKGYTLGRTQGMFKWLQRQTEL